MALLLCHFPLLSPSSSLSSSSSSPFIPIVAATLLSKSKVPQKSLIFQNGSFHGIRIPSPTYAKRPVVVRASLEIDGKDGESKPDALPPSEGSEEAAMSVENLPLESKQKQIMEQRLKMKLAKKIRLRRKRLLRKRKMRKKGRWPPSKMKKLKNV